MTASVMPRFIAAGTGQPAYFIRTASNDVTLRRYDVVLPENSGFRFAQLSEVTPEAVELTVAVVAELLLVSGIEPDAAPVELVVAVHRALGLCRCDLSMVAGIAEAYLAEHWECAKRQLDRYTLAAGRLCGVEL